MRANFRRRQNQRRVHVDHRITGRCHSLQGFGQKHGRVGALPTLVGRRKKGPNIRSCDGAQQRIGKCVQKDVTIRVPTQSLGMRQVMPPILSGISRLNS